MNIQGFIETLPVMVYGMAGIFVVILVIYAIIFLLNKFTK